MDGLGLSVFQSALRNPPWLFPDEQRYISSSITTETPAYCGLIQGQVAARFLQRRTTSKS